MSANSVWSDELVAALKDGWDRGLSCAEIAREIGCGVTRSAVLGKARRLGLSPVAPFLKATVGDRRQVQATNPQTALRKERSIFGRKLATGLLWKGAHDTGPVSLEDLAPDGCRWPIGDGHPFLFCNDTADAGKPYCAHHRAIAYRVVPLPTKTKKVVA